MLYLADEMLRRQFSRGRGARLYGASDESGDGDERSFPTTQAAQAADLLSTVG